METKEPWSGHFRMDAPKRDHAICQMAASAPPSLKMGGASLWFLLPPRNQEGENQQGQRSSSALNGIPPDFNAQTKKRRKPLLNKDLRRFN